MKKILSLFLATLISLSLAIPAFAANATNPTYSDVPSSHWAYSYVEAVTSKGLFGGIGGGKFSPETPFTRAQISQVLYNAYSKTLTGTLDSNTAVNGMTGNEWYKTPLRWALGYTLLDGTYYDMGSIYGASPNATVDRKCMALAMYRVADALDVELPITNAATAFPDIANLNAEYRTAITALQQAGVLAGFPDGNYGPNSPLTRAQAATILDRFTDIPGLESVRYSTGTPPIEPSHPLDTNTVYGYINLKAKEYGFYLVEEGNDLTTKKADYLVHYYGIYEEDDYYRATFYDGWITDRGWTDYCVFLHEKSKDGLPVVIFFYNPSKGPDDDLWYVSAYMLRSDLFMGSEGILDDSNRIDIQLERIGGWA